MIPCHDLRTGNIILANNRFRKVTYINNSLTLNDHSQVGVESPNSKETEIYDVANIDPVPLSTAIMQQCHFNFHPYFKFWQLINTKGTRTEMDIDHDFTLIDFMRRPVVKHISSLHQLQNIYYTLFNKELDFDVTATLQAISN